MPLTCSRSAKVCALSLCRVVKLGDIKTGPSVIVVETKIFGQYVFLCRSLRPTSQDGCARAHSWGAIGDRVFARERFPNTDVKKWVVRDSFEQCFENGRSAAGAANGEAARSSDDDVLRLSSASESQNVSPEKLRNLLLLKTVLSSSQT